MSEAKSGTHAQVGDTVPGFASLNPGYENAARDLLGLPLMPYTQLRYVTCLDLGRSGAVITQGWERRVEKTGAEGKAVKRWINTQLIYPPAGGTAEGLLAHSSTDLAERAGRLDGAAAASDPPAGKAA